jgi:hypothetical protein
MSAATELLSELEKAHQIIANAMRIMTPEQKHQWAQVNDGAGLVESGTTRFHERRKAISNARAAMADGVLS